MESWKLLEEIAKQAQRVAAANAAAVKAREVLIAFEKENELVVENHVRLRGALQRAELEAKRAQEEALQTIGWRLPKEEI